MEDAQAAGRQAALVGVHAQGQSFEAHVQRLDPEGVGECGSPCGGAGGDEPAQPGQRTDSDS